MAFPESADRCGQYSICGLVLARTAEGIGANMTEELSQRWANTMAHLAVVDEISETKVSDLPDGLAVLDALNLEANPGLRDAADGFLAANQQSHQAQDFATHSRGRSLEAYHCSNLLRHQSPDDIRQDRWLWSQLSGISVASIHFDSFIDSREDAPRLPQFSLPTLMVGSLRSLARSMRSVDISSWVAFTRACQEYELDAYVIKKIPKPFLPTGDKDQGRPLDGLVVVS